MKKNGSSDKGEPRFKKRAQTQDGPSAPKVKIEKGGVSQNVKTTCVKLLVMFQRMMLQQRGICTHFELDKKIWMKVMMMRVCPLYYFFSDMRSL